MRKFVALTLLISLGCSGCIFLAAGAVGGYVAAKMGTKESKDPKRKSQLTEIQRRNLETREVEGNNREDVLRSVVTVLQDRGYAIQASDYQGGIITAVNQNPFLQVTTTIESFTRTRIRMRISMKDKNGIIEDPEIFDRLYDDIQTEVFRRSNLK